jgi:polar amino acid transport system substrate-binding protein
MRRLFASLAISLALAAPAAAAERVLDVASTIYPPYYGPDLPQNGFITEIVAEAFAGSGYRMNLEFVPWKRAFEGAKLGDYHALFTVWHRPEREAWFLYSEPLPANEVGFFRRRDKPLDYAGIASLSGQLIGVVRGYALPPEFEGAELTTSVVADDEQNLRNLARGRVDLVLADRILARHILQEQLPESADQIVWIDPPVTIEPQHFVVSRAVDGAEEILAAFDTGLARMRENGRVEAIMRKHGF